MGSVPRLARTLGLAAACLLALAAPAAAHNPPTPGGVEVVASGLDNPRGLDLVDGVLVVTEAGRGGSGPCVPGPEMGPVCFGTSGAVTAVDLWHGGQQRVITGLPSLANPANAAENPNGNATGPSDISFGPKGAYLTIGLGGPANTRSLLPAAGQIMGTVKRIRFGGRLELVADLDAFEHAVNPDRAQPPAPRIESNPNSIDAKGRPIAVADAGGNDILDPDRGAVSVLALLPFGSAPFPAMPSPPPGSPPPGTIIPVDPVPTSVVRGPDGSLYVGQLTGFPFVPGAAHVFRIPAGGGTPQVVASDLSFITDIALGRDGSLYVVEFATQPFPTGPGALIRIKPDGTRTVLAADLVNPTGIVLGRHAAYVSNHGAEAGAGEVLRIPLGS
jgi:hypothetical protein